MFVSLHGGRVARMAGLCYIHYVYSILVMTMQTGSIFENNRTQAVRLPTETRFPDNIRKVMVRVVGEDRILSPLDRCWDSFFLAQDAVSDDFLPERASQQQPEREPF